MHNAAQNESMLPATSASSTDTALTSVAVTDSQPTEFDDELYLTSSRPGDSVARNESEASTSSEGTDSGWSRLQNRLEHLSDSISRKIPHRLHSRKCSDESQENSSSSGFSSAQNSPKSGGTSLAAYENFLIIDDDCSMPHNIDNAPRGSTSAGRCTGVLRMGDDLGLQRGESLAGPSLDPLQVPSGPTPARAPSSNCSWWDKIRIITSAITLRQQPFQPFTPSPSGSLLPNTAPPSASSVAALRLQQQHQPGDQHQQPDTPSSAATATDGTSKSLHDLQEERRQRIRRFVYIAQGALILIVALIWLASNFVNLKTPSSSSASLVEGRENATAATPLAAGGSEGLSAATTIPPALPILPVTSAPAGDLSASANAVTVDAEEPKIVSKGQLKQTDKWNSNASLTIRGKGVKKASMTSALIGNNLLDDVAGGAAIITGMEDKRETRKNRDEEGDLDEPPSDDPHKIDKRWRR